MSAVVKSVSELRKKAESSKQNSPRFVLLIRRVRIAKTAVEHAAPAHWQFPMPLCASLSQLLTMAHLWEEVIMLWQLWT